jgi:hypothetical protein
MLRRRQGAPSTLGTDGIRPTAASRDLLRRQAVGSGIEYDRMAVQARALLPQLTGQAASASRVPGRGETLEPDAAICDSMTSFQNLGTV